MRGDSWRNPAKSSHLLADCSMLIWSAIGALANDVQLIEGKLY